MIPTRDQCFVLLRKYNYYKDEISLKHILLVEKVANHIAGMFIERGLLVNKNLISRGALLHDIGKDIDIKRPNHALRGYEICVNEAIDNSICLIVRNHDMYNINQLVNWEEKIVSYADKLCNEEVLGIEERFIDLDKRHTNWDSNNAREKTRLLEKELLATLNLTPEELYSQLRAIA